MSNEKAIRLIREEADRLFASKEEQSINKEILAELKKLNQHLGPKKSSIETAAEDLGNFRKQVRDRYENGQDRMAKVAKAARQQSFSKHWETGLKGYGYKLQSSNDGKLIFVNSKRPARRIAITEKGWEAVDSGVSLRKSKDNNDLEKWLNENK